MIDGIECQNSIRFVDVVRLCPAAHVFCGVSALDCAATVSLHVCRNALESTGRVRCYCDFPCTLD